MKLSNLRPRGIMTVLVVLYLLAELVIMIVGTVL